MLAQAFSDIRFVNARLEGRTAIYGKTYWRSENTGPFCDNCNLIANPWVGLNLPGGEALMEFRGTKFQGSLSVPHHGYNTGGQLAAQYVFTGDVEIRNIFDEGLTDPSALIVTVGSSVNHLIDGTRAAFDNFDALGCANKFSSSPRVLTCSNAGPLRPLKLYGWGPDPVQVQVRNVDGSASDHSFAHYNKKSMTVDRYDYAYDPIYGGYSFVVRAGATVTIVSPNPIFAVDFGHLGWEGDEIMEITLNLSAPRGDNEVESAVSNCRLRTDHPRRWMTPFGPTQAIETSSLCS